MSNEELVIRIQAGIVEADNMLQLWQQCRKFITMLAKKYRGSAEIEDLEQEGYLALNEAVRKYDTSRSVPFINYAAYWMKQYMRRYIDNHSGTVRIPVHTRETIARYHKIVAALKQTYRREPTDQEMCYYMTMDLKQFEQLKKDVRMARLKSLDEAVPGAEGESITYTDTVASEENIESDVTQAADRQQLCLEIQEQLAALPTEQSAVIYSRFFEGRTLKETGQQLGKGMEGARQIESKAMRELRKPHRSRKLRPYFDEYLAGCAYRHVGVSSFHRTRMSATERSVWQIIEEEERLSQQYGRRNKRV